MASWQDFAAPVAAQQGPPGQPAMLPQNVSAAPNWADFAELYKPAEMAGPPAPPPPESNAEAIERERGENPLGAVGHVMDKVRGFDEQAQRALTFGLSDKAAAAGAGINASVGHGVKWLANRGAEAVGLSRPFDENSDQSFSDAYHQELQKQRGYGEQYAAAHPVASKVATVGGTLLSVPLSGAASPSPATLGGRIAQGIKQGGAMGALSGFGNTNDESLAKDAIDTGTGAAIGAGVGGAVPVVADKVVSPVWNWLTRQFGSSAVDSQAMQRIVQRIRQDTQAGGPTAQTMLDALDAAGSEPHAIADVGGNNVLGEAGRVARAPGPGKQLAIDALNSRDAAEGANLSRVIGSDISAGGSAYGAGKALIEARAAASQPLYDAALNGVDEAGRPRSFWSPRLQEFLNDPVMQPALRRGIELERLESTAQNRPFNPSALGVDLDPQGNIAYRDVPNMRTLDIGKKGLDAMIADERNGVTGRLSQRGVALDQFRRAYLGELDQLNPQYAAARAAYSGPSQSLDALNDGAQFMMRRPEEIADDIAKLSPGEREFYKLGAADTLMRRVASAPPNANEAARVSNSQYARQQLRPLFESDDAFNNFMGAIDRANRRFETRFQTIGNSATAGRIAEDDAGHAGNPLASGIAEAGAGLMTGEHLPVAGGLWNTIKGLGQNRPPQDPLVNAAISRMLFATDPAVRRELIQRMISMQSAPSLLPGVSRGLAAELAGQPGALRQIPYVNQVVGR